MPSEPSPKYGAPPEQPGIPADQPTPPSQPHPKEPPIPPSTFSRAVPSVTPPPLTPPGKTKGCLFWGITAAAIFFFVLAMLLFLAFFTTVSAADGVHAGGIGLGRNFVEQTVEGDGDHKILLISINGVITDGGSEFSGDSNLVSTTRKILQAARLDPDVKAVLLYISSPGGGITASDILYHEINLFKSETGKPVLALLGDVAASGGYYIAAASNRIIAHPTTITGSIGVLLPLFGIEEMMDKIGVQPRTIKSGDLKDIGSIMRSMKPEEAALLQGIVNEYRNRFVSIVHDGMKGRGIDISRDELEKYCDGRIFTSSRALENKLIDEIGYFDEAVNATCDKAGVARDKARVVTYVRKPGILESLLVSSSIRQPQSLTIHLDALSPSKSPQFMYLWSAGAPTTIVEK